METTEMLRAAADSAPVERVRHDVKLRSLAVAGVERVTPGMLRVTLVGEDLADFPSLGFDDHVKLLVPGAGDTVERRDYTPRRFDRRTRTLAIDFALHDAGPATRWALRARPGDRLQVAGPKGSAVIGPAVRSWLLVGDETALPAVGRCIEEARPGTRITSVVAVAGPGEEQAFDTAARLTALWAHRPLSAAPDPAALLAALDTVPLEPGTFVWIAAEAGVARAVRTHLLDGRGHPKGWSKAAGYWVAGRPDAHERLA